MLCYALIILGSDILMVFVAFKRIFEFIAVFLLVWGGVVVALRLLVSEWHHIRGQGDRIHFERIRMEFGQRIVLAIEFLIAADLIESILNPTLEELMRLGVIVLIRTVLSYFLTQEVDRHERVWKR